MASVTEKNKAHWDEHAANYDARFQKTIDELIGLLRDPAILTFINVPWLPDSDSDTPSDTPTHTIKLLDYACGTGLITRAFLPYITRAVGVDLSGSMVGQYNLHAHNQGLGKEEMYAVEGNLLVGEGRLDGEVEGKGKGDLYEFDIAVVGLGFHHFADARLAAKRLGERLKKGGVLVVVDFESHGPGHGDSHGGGHSHSHSHSHGHSHAHSHEQEAEAGDLTKQVKETITHHGFSEDEIRTIFEDAGVGAQFGYRVLGKGIVFHGVHGDGKKEGERKEMRRGVFIARGAKV